MPRIRTVKPEFFQHEPLFDAELASGGLPLRLAFAGLWTVADKAGRFEWRPRQLKLNVLPYDECDFSAVLSALESSGFIMRYAVEGKVYGCIPSWDKHQHKNTREPDSTIPGPDDELAEQVHAPAEASASTSQGECNAKGIGKGREGKGREGACMHAHMLAHDTPGLDRTTFDRWIAYRRELGKPYKPSSIEAAAVELAKHGTDQAAVVQQSIANGWQGLFALKRPNGQIPPDKPKRPPPTEEEVSAERRKAANENRQQLAQLGLVALKPMPQ